MSSRDGGRPCPCGSYSRIDSGDDQVEHHGAFLKTVEDLNGREIILISLEERANTTSAAGELVFHAFGAIGQFERRPCGSYSRIDSGDDQVEHHGAFLKTVEDLNGREIILISLEERANTTSAAGELVFHAFGAIGQFERRQISFRTKDGLAPARMHWGSLDVAA